MVLDDWVAYVLVGATGFFLAVAFGLLYRYRQASQKLNESTDLGRDLWEALDGRMKKQDQRIIDLMARLEVLQARVTSSAPSPPPLAFPAPAPPAPAPAPTEEIRKPLGVPVPEPRPVMASQSATSATPESQVTPEPVTEIEPAPAPLPAPVSPRQIKLDKTSLKALQLLKNGPMTTDKLWDRKALNMGREHTSRVMKKLFELGLVSRDDANKPYTYQLSVEGRKYV